MKTADFEASRRLLTDYVNDCEARYQNSMEEIRKSNVSLETRRSCFAGLAVVRYKELSHYVHAIRKLELAILKEGLDD